ncbi:YIP1 family protein [Phaeobacter sp. J2-8]|uniref:YIP1 family protein n=1 Tax=Phaeobacter sp. J2-8 TaxID=2931394 RepID=UPI001FD067A8|nr:YIP1 family protein [Phaeobacter sp. J2-8]MCJ7875079.1 YIP1 family protein [Phaeobacter sp. J2-8]
MSVTRDIVATYRGPRRVVRRLLAWGQREDRVLAMVMAGCLMMFVSRWPVVARQSHFEGTEMQPSIGAALFGWLMVAPLLLYALAAVSHLIARVLGGQGDFYGARLALFWALLATSPLVLLFGLVEGFIGQGIQSQAVGFLWFVIFLWFWLSGLREAEGAAS